MEILLVAALTLIASFIGTIAGFGLSTIMVPLLVLYLPLGQALILVGIIHFFDDVWKMVFFKRKKILWRLIIVFGLAGLIFSVLGASLATNINQGLLAKIIGGALLLYIIVMVTMPKLKVKRQLPNLVAGGALSGFMAGVSGIGGPIRTMFISAYKLPKAQHLFSLGAVALFLDVARLVTYWRGGFELSQMFLLGLILFIPCSWLGAKFGAKVVKKIPQKEFRLIILVVLLIIAVRLILN